MIHSLRQIEKAHPLKKGTCSDVQRIHLSGNSATHDHRADGFASHSFERFAFFTYFIAFKLMQFTCQLANKFKIILFQDVAL